MFNILPKDEILLYDRQIIRAKNNINHFVWVKGVLSYC